MRSLAVAAALALPLVAEAQDTLRLSAVQEAALRSDPRAPQRELLRAATNIRRQVIGADRLPRLSVNGFASHQSDVTRPAFGIPGVTFPELPRDRWQTTLDLEQPIYDGGDVSRRQALEDARHAESAAALDVALYELRSEVDAAFHSAFLLEKRTRVRGPGHRPRGEARRRHSLRRAGDRRATASSAPRRRRNGG